MTQKFNINNQFQTMIAVDGHRYLVPSEFYAQVEVGTVVKFDGTKWTIVGRES